MNLLHIVEGWSKSLELIGTSDEIRELSKKRMTVCATCPKARESRFLKIFRGSADDVPAIYCTICKCPCNEKSLVKNETCPLGKWQ